MGFEEAVRKTLRRYTLSCVNFWCQNGIEDNSIADTKNAIEKKYASKSKKMFSDPIGKNAIKLLKDSLYGSGNIDESDYIKGIWDIDEIPRGKRTALLNHYLIVYEN